MGDYVKTILLLGLLSAFLVVVGGLVGGRQGLYFAFFLSLVMNAGAYFFSDKLALASSGAKPLSQQDAPEVYSMVHGLAQQMNMPMPKMYLIPTPQANAFATGRSPQHASVAVTEGILQLLSQDELKGVLAHELGHVKNRDILIASVAAVLASTIAFLSRMGMYGGYSNDERERGGGAGVAILLALLGPIAGTIIQMAISREREFEADETGAEILHTGEPLASALQKIHGSVKQTPMNINPAFSSLYIDNPLGGVGGSLMKLFSTHPPTEERIKRLRNMSLR